MKITEIKTLLGKVDKNIKFIKKPYSQSKLELGGVTLARNLSHANGEFFSKSPEIISQLLKQLERCKEFIKLCDIEPEGLGDLAADCMADLEAIEEGK